jgi:S-layer homology domain
MKSLATTFLIFATCIVVAGTIALIDQAQATLDLSSGDSMLISAGKVAGAGNTITLGEFAETVEERFSLPQPDAPVSFDDLRPSDPDYTAAQTVYPFLHRQLICPECALTSHFYPKNPLTHAQAAVVLVSILATERKITLLNTNETSDVLATVPDADSVSIFARPYIATALAYGILPLQAEDMVRPTQSYSRAEVTALLNTVLRRFPCTAATASLHISNEVRR